MSFRRPTLAAFVLALAATACAPAPSAPVASTAPSTAPAASALPGTVDDTALAAIALTTRAGAGSASFADLDQDTDGNDATSPEVQARFAAPGHAGADAAVTVRGGKAARAGAKSLKIQLAKGAPDYRGADEILLNKNLRDLSAVRDRLGHALLASVPEVPTPYSWFASLTTDGTDRGLFTQIERVDKGFLKRLGLDGEGYLYQADDFEFRKHGGDVGLASAAGYVQDKFEDHLEIEGIADHVKLVAMLDALDDKDLAIDDVIATHFDRANLLTWLAVNVLTERLDGAVDGYWLQAARDAGPWKVFADSYETGFGWHDQPSTAEPRASLPRWQEGPAAWWRSRLVSRFLQNPANVQALLTRIEVLAAGPFAPGSIQTLLTAWKPQVAPHLAATPGWEAEYDRLPGTAAASLTRFKAAMGRPMPPGDLKDAATATAGQWKFSWDASYDLQGDKLTYDLTIARDPGLTDVVSAKPGLTETEATLALPSGTYYWTVVAKDAGGEWQSALGNFKDNATGKSYPGVERLEAK